MSCVRYVRHYAHRAHPPTHGHRSNEVHLVSLTIDFHLHPAQEESSLEGLQLPLEELQRHVLHMSPTPGGAWDWNSQRRVTGGLFAPASSAVDADGGDDRTKPHGAPEAVVARSPGGEAVSLKDVLHQGCLMSGVVLQVWAYHCHRERNVQAGRICTWASLLILNSDHDVSVSCFLVPSGGPVGCFPGRACRGRRQLDLQQDASALASPCGPRPDPASASAHRRLGECDAVAGTQSAKGGRRVSCSVVGSGGSRGCVRQQLRYVRPDHTQDPRPYQHLPQPSQGCQHSQPRRDNGTDASGWGGD